MSWITENPWPLVLILGGITIVMLILGDSKGRIIALMFALIAVAVYFLESAIVTPGEKIEAQLAGLLQSFIAEDLNAINAQIDDEAPELKDTAKKGLELVNLDKSFHMQDIVITVADDEQTAIAELRANGSMTVVQANMPYHAATRWRTHWKLKRDQWKLSDVQRLNIVTGEEMGTLDPQ